MALIFVSAIQIYEAFDGKWTVRYKSISDILISRFSGVNKCSQGRNIFMIEFDSSWYIISLIHISAEIPAYTVLFLKPYM